MATFFEYKCKGCGYTVNANPKGKDIVMMGERYIIISAQNVKRLLMCYIHTERSLRKSFVQNVAQKNF